MIFRQTTTEWSIIRYRNDNTMIENDIWNVKKIWTKLFETFD